MPTILPMYNSTNPSKKKTNREGFTLIELLIVIAIIGILAGIVLAVLNPGRQRQRAREGTLRANVNKLCLAYASCKAASVDEDYSECRTDANADNLGVDLSKLNGTPAGATYGYLDNIPTNGSNAWGGYLDVDNSGGYASANDCAFYCDDTTNIPTQTGSGCATAD